VGELLCDAAAEDAYEELAVRVSAAGVPRLLTSLSGLERRVIEGRYGFDGRQRTLRELGHTIGVSAERVRQIEATALERLRDGRDRPQQAAADADSSRTRHLVNSRSRRRHFSRGGSGHSERELRRAGEWH
jgi:DNA-directed RNA polymerase sigma subunit (sigma70/sigma32)